MLAKLLQHNTGNQTRIDILNTIRYYISVRFCISVEEQDHVRRL